MKEPKSTERRDAKRDNQQRQAPSKRDLSSIPKPQLVESIKRDIKRMIRT